MDKELTTEEYMKSLPLGTRLHVINGHWYCRICGSKDNKKLYIEWDGKTYHIDCGVNHLEVEIVK